eukprot:CAMPEP_0170482662 /NCGR_PEP_ID=MMETSP0208-20121228/2583_1 /TAXON_ID=197538 /ORGANISM="Strombidium inclinatum, Strain S3" /LENGTH=221 /DNA_ID=CAMNT_0010755521 /DNA_START=3 /DNA_END=665 /DNA_ORIENTATION=-
MNKRITATSIQEAKQEGSKAFKNRDYGKAVAYYRQAMRNLEIYGQQNEGGLPFKMEIGDCPEPGENLMYYQDFVRLKAVLLNNLSSCFYFQGQIDQAEKLNDLSIIEDPDYARAHFRKCTILEKRGEITQAIILAEGAIEQFSHEMETDEGNRAMVPEFESLIQEIKPKKDIEQSVKRQRLEQEVQKELDRAMPDFPFDLQAELEKGAEDDEEDLDMEALD